MKTANTNTPSFSRLILSLGALLLSLNALAGSFSVKTVSANLWRRNQQWSTRMQNVISLINAESAEVVGLQEGDEGKQAELAAALPDYNLETGPWNDGASGILYKHSVVEVVTSGNFGYSSQPDNPAVSDWGDGAIHGWLRVCNWVLFRFKSSGEEFYIYNTHLDANGFSPDPAYWRSQEVRLLVDRISTRANPSVPFILIGDLNGVESEEAITYLKNGSGNPVHMVDTYREILPSGPGDSFGAVKYDYIMVADDAASNTTDAEIIYHSQYGWTSDHNQVAAEVQFTTSSSSGDPIKAMSFNVRVGVDGGNQAWDARKQNCVDIVNQVSPDFMGIQEAFPNQKDDLDNMLPAYAEFGRGREADGSGEGSQIFYKTSRWELDATENGTFQLSPTPEVPGSNGWGFGYKRICTWGRFRDKVTNQHVYVYNTHYPLDGNGRTLCSNLIAGRIAARTHNTEPVLLTGDFNADEGEESIQIFKGGFGSPISMVDTWREIHPTEINKGTFSGWSSSPNAGAKIDYVFAMGHNDVDGAEIVYQSPGTIVSDHFPIWGEVSFSAGSDPVISNISHDPNIPKSTETVTVSATIIDNGSISNATLNWGTSSGNLINSVTMSGAGNSYSAVIPNHPDGTQIFYSITATDNEANSVTSPESNYTVSDNPQILLADYDNIDLTFTGFAGSNFNEITNPYQTGINTSLQVGCTTQGFETWSGIYSATLSSKVDFATTPIFKMKVYGPKTGDVLVKFEEAGNSSNFYEQTVAITQANTWQEVTVDFSSAPSNQFNVLVLFFDYGNNALDTYYFDDLMLTTVPANDCNGDPGGSAFLDSCGQCAAGNTGVTPILDPMQCITGVEEELNEIGVYPNPCSESVTIIGKGDVIIINNLGQKVIERELNGKTTINTSEWKSGIYLLNVQTQNGVQRKKLLKR